MLQLILLLLVLALPARADVATVSLLPGWREGPRHLAGLQIALDPGWKTYWRAPGEAGIPPSFDWTGSTNLAAVEVLWPTPQVFTQSGLRSVGYSGGVVLPLVVRPRDPRRPVDLRLSLDMGVCQDICVPVSTRIGGRLPAGANRADPRIRAAVADRPLTETEAPAGDLTCTLSPTDAGVEIAASLSLPPMGAPEHSVIELPDPTLWITEARTERTGGRLDIRAEVMPPRGRPVSIDRSELRLTILGSHGAVEILGCD